MSTDDDKPINHPRNEVRVSTVERDGELNRKRGEKAAARHRELWGEGGADGMVRLCRLFPSLRHVHGADPWDATAMLRFACSGHSHGETLAARFVLTVWNCTDDWNEIAHTEGILTGPDEQLRRFDIFEALGTWDYAHHEAALTWLRDPFWP